MSSTEISRSRVEDYLTIIYRLEEALGVTRITDISRELKVSPATVSKIVGKLEKRNLVKRIKYRYVQLTNEGKKIAEQIIRKHRIAEVFLSKMLGFDEVESHLYAHYLEHLPDVVVERIFVLVGKPDRCPHGNIIPGTEEVEEDIVSLGSVEKGQTCVIKRIAGEFIDVLEYLHNLGIRIGDAVMVVESNDRCVKLKNISGLLIEIPSYYIRFVFVKC